MNFKRVHLGREPAKNQILHEKVPKLVQMSMLYTRLFSEPTKKTFMS